MYITYREINRNDGLMGPGRGYIKLSPSRESCRLAFPQSSFSEFSVKLCELSDERIAFDLIYTENRSARKLDTVVLDGTAAARVPFEAYKSIGANVLESYIGELEFEMVTNAEAHTALLGGGQLPPREVLLDIAGELLMGDECERDVPQGIKLAAMADNESGAALLYALLADESINSGERAEFIALIAQYAAESLSGDMRTLYAELLLTGEGVERDPVLATELLASKFVRNYPYPARHRALKCALLQRGCDERVVRHLDILELAENRNVYTVSELCMNISELALSNADLSPLAELNEYKTDIDIKIAVAECFAGYDKSRAYSIFSDISQRYKLVFCNDSALEAALARARLGLVTLALDDLQLAECLDDIVFNAGAYIAYLLDMREHDGERGLFKHDPYDGDIERNISLAEAIIKLAADKKIAIAERVSALRP